MDDAPTDFQPIFQHGDTVRRRNRPDELGNVQGAGKMIAGQFYYKVRFDRSVIPVDVAESDLEPFIYAQTIPDLLHEGAFAEKVTFSRLITFERLHSPLNDNLYALRASRTRFEPYQFKPLLKFLQSPKQRLLLADEVGLGKTIETGFILSEILARHPQTFRRVLVICKASLCIKWQMEMRKRFDLAFDIWRVDQFMRFLDEFSRDPESAEIRAICSLESFRNRGLMQRWEEMPPTLDVLIIDEAHHLKNTETLSHRACRAASEVSDAALALTATPIHIGSRDLYNVLSLLDPEEFSSFEAFEACMSVNQKIVETERLVTQNAHDRFQRIHKILHDLVARRSVTPQFSFAASASELVIERLRTHPLFGDTLERLQRADPGDRRETIEIQRQLAELNFLSRIFTRTRKREVYEGAHREAHVVPVPWTPAERGFYNAVTEYVRASYQRAGCNPALLFGLMMPQRQIASCIPAMVEYYRAELGNGDEIRGLAREEADVSLADWDTDVEQQADAARHQLLRIIDQWHQDGAPDTKFEQLRRSFEELDRTQPGERIVIFSYFKKTLEYLSRRLSALGYSNTVISGAYSPEEREQRIDRFRDGEVRVLLSSEVGSEGLDFQFCHILFNYDLPWNPMVVEQRIGRLDRYGQTAEKIQIYTLSCPGTIEDTILTRLYQRINIFKAYIGDLEDILGNKINELTRDLFDPSLTAAQRERKVEDTAFLLERRKKQLEEWESASAQFVGQDQYYIQEIERISELGRFISAVDLRVFVEEFLAKYDSRSEIEQHEQEGLFVLSAGERLIGFLQQCPEDPQKFDFLRRACAGALHITFDSELAERLPEVAYVHVRHFFVRGIVAYYRDHAESFHRVARISLRECKEIRRGEYLYLVGRARLHAARERNALLPVLVRMPDLHVMDELTSEIALGHMIREGTPPEGLPELDPNLLERAYAKAYETLEERFRRSKQEAARVNDAMVTSRIASLQQSYDVKVQKKRHLLSQAIDRHRDARYIRMLEGYIRHLERERQAKVNQVEELRQLTGDFAEIAAGYLKVKSQEKNRALGDE
jgi:superfamily II DNA or RNA helicase